MAGIGIHGVSRSFGAVKALERVDLRVEDGEFLTLLGPSGSGKTTLLNLIAGLDEPTEGRIVIGDQDVTDLPSAKRNVGLVFQSYALFPHMTVAQNVAFPLKVRKRPDAEIRDEVRRALTMVQLDGFEDRKPSQLSGGQQQRVALARATVFHPALLLLDEPLGALDRNLRENLQLELRRLHARLGLTTVMVTHDQEEAMSLSDRIAVFNKGCIEQIGSARELYLRPANLFVANFLGSGNIFEGMIGKAASGEVIQTSDGLHLSFSDPTAAVGRAAQAMLRPEAVRLTRADDAILHGELTDQIYLGSFVRQHVRLSNGRMIVAMNRAGGDGFQAGDMVGLSWATDELRVLPE